MFIPDPNFFHPGSQILIFFIPDPGSRIRLKEFMYFNPQKWFLSTQKYDPGFSSQIRIPDPDFLPILDPGSRIQGSKRYRIPDPGSNRYRIPDPSWIRIRNTDQQNEEIAKKKALNFLKKTSTQLCGK
jgi:hypothetical protein